MRGRSPHKLRPRTGAAALPTTPRASGGFRRPDPVSLQQLLEVAAEFDHFGGASLGLLPGGAVCRSGTGCARLAAGDRSRADQARRSRLARAALAAQNRGLGGRPRTRTPAPNPASTTNEPGSGGSQAQPTPAMAEMAGLVMWPRGPGDRAAIGHRHLTTRISRSIGQGSGARADANACLHVGLLAARSVTRCHATVDHDPRAE